MAGEREAQRRRGTRPRELLEVERSSSGGHSIEPHARDAPRAADAGQCGCIGTHWRTQRMLIIA